MDSFHLTPNTSFVSLLPRLHRAGHLLLPAEQSTFSNPLFLSSIVIPCFCNQLIYLPTLLAPFSNLRRMLMRGRGNRFVPCTPLGCMELLARSGVTVKGRSCVVS